MSNVISLNPSDPVAMGAALHAHFTDVTQRISLCSHILYETTAFDAHEMEVRAAIQLNKAVKELDAVWAELDHLLCAIRSKQEVANG